MTTQPEPVRLRACPFWWPVDYAAEMERMLIELARRAGRTENEEALHWRLPGHDRPITYPPHRST